MKKNLFFLLMIVTVGSLFVGCDKADVIEVQSGEVLITISVGAPIQTKGDTDAEYYTVHGQLNDVEYATYAVNVISEDGTLKSTVYSQGGTPLFTDTIIDGVVIKREYNDEMLEFLNQDEFETKARQVGESYGGCLKRTINDMKKAANENTPVLCDFVGCCGAISATVAVVDCAQYEKK
jgi:hypothetical protein